MAEQTGRQAAQRINLPAWTEMLDMSGRERVLEVGCGDGTFLAQLAATAGELVGLEATGPGAIAAHELFRTLPVPAKLHIGHLLDLSDASGFDVIVIRRGLEQVDAAIRTAWCRKLASLLRPGGLLYLADESSMAEAWLSNDDGWHNGVIAAGLSIRREVVRVPTGLEMVATKPMSKVA